MSVPTDTKQNLVDLYKLLELEPLEKDPSKIHAALKKLVRIAKESSDTQVAKRAAKILELGKQNLLDPERKAIYDQKWKAAQSALSSPGSKSTDVEEARPTIEEFEDWDWSELDEILPHDDYAAEFDLAAFLEHAATLPAHNLQADYNKLEMLLGGTPQGEVAEQSPQASGPSVSAQNAASQPSSVISTATSPQVTQAVPASKSAAKGSQLSHSPTNGSSSKSLSKKMRKKRDRSLLLTSAGLLASVAAILALIFALVNFNDEDTPEVANNPSQPQSPAEPLQIQPQNPPPQQPRRSGLSVPNLPANLNLEQPTPPPADAPPQEQPTENTAPTQQPSMQPNVESAKPKPQPVPSKPKPQPDPQLTDAEKAEWRERLAAIAAHLSRQEYSATAPKFTDARAAAKTSVQKRELARLETVSTLAEECQQALVQAVTGMSVGESFNVGSRPVSFVEGTPEKIIVRISGRNATYPLTELPVGLFEGLVDLTLDIENESALARRAAFVLFHPKNNDISLKKARERMQAAEDAGRVPKGTTAIFDAEYLQGA